MIKAIIFMYPLVISQDEPKSRVVNKSIGDATLGLYLKLKMINTWFTFTKMIIASSTQCKNEC